MLYDSNNMTFWKKAKPWNGSWEKRNMNNRAQRIFRAADFKSFL